MNHPKSLNRKICVITGTRAEYGLMRWIMEEIKLNSNLTLQIIATGAHLSKSHGDTINEIIADGFTVDKKVPILNNADSNSSVNNAIGLSVAKIGEALSDLKPDMVVLLGDRYEILGAAIAAYTLRIPIGHIHGGETTFGALDEGYRHAITKLATVHFVAADEYKDRVIQMGEQPNTVFNFGAPGVEGIHRANNVQISEINEILNFQLQEKRYAVACWHPETMDKDNGIDTFKNLLNVLPKLKGKLKIVFSKSNADPSGQMISKMIEDFVSNNKDWTTVFTSLGHRRFLGLLKNSAFLIGNSSSGIIEAPALNIPTINIGARQKGRLRASSIIDCETNLSSIENAIKKLDSEEFKKLMNQNRLPYGNGFDVAKSIVKQLEKIDLGSLAIKTFYDIK